MIRNIIKIDSSKCNGCGKCAEACSEGAIKMIEGKAVLIRDAYCDGLGACLPACPADAISIEKREAEPYSQAKADLKKSQAQNIIPMACPGSGARTIVHNESEGPTSGAPGRLSQWPVQLRLIPPSAPFLNGCDLLVAADCSAYAYGNFHDRFIRGRVVVVGCPKLDPAESWNKLNDIIAANNIKSITVTRMDVPCCNGIVNAVMSAVQASGKEIPVEIFTLYPDGSAVKN